MSPFRTISVVIPVKNDGLLLERCLECLARQSVPPDEVIVVDNGSDDLTSIVAAWWGAIRVYQPSPGIPAASSAGYDAARCEVIARLDADSEPPMDWVERVLGSFSDDPELAAVTGPGRFRSLPGPMRRLADGGYMRPYFALMGRLLGHPPLFGSNFAMTRTVWRSVREATHTGDPEVHDDLDLSFRLPRGSRVMLDETLAVPISARPFRSPVSFARRVRRGVHTVWVNRDVLRPRSALAD
jgi:glycosyltransferase involved in cell wall biosynthesis